MKKHLATVAAFGLWFVTGCSEGPTAAPTEKPAVIKPVVTAPATSWADPVDGAPVYFRVRAEGVQIYEPKEKDGKVAWTYKAPEALLYNDKGRAVGKHYMGKEGATWEFSDGSKIVGEKTGVLEKPGTLPWLTIKVKGHEGPAGKFTPVTYAQRVDTDGGVAPGALPLAGQAGKEERVPYRATYLFYVKK